jgi:hypothetical protein
MKKGVGAPKRELINGKELDRNDPINAHKLPTAGTLAQEHGVSAPTIKRDGQYVAAIEKIKEVDPDINTKISTGKFLPKKTF